MRIVHITGAAPVAPEDADNVDDLLVRIILQSRRWWQRRTRYTPMVLVGQPGAWYPYAGKKMPPAYVVREVERAIRAAWADMAAELTPKTGFTMTELRAVSKPRDGLVPPDVGDTSEEYMNRSLDGHAE